MAMTGTGLAAAISAIPGIVITNEAELAAFCDALIQYIQENAVVVGVTTGVQTGVSTAPVEGTVT